MVKDSYLETTEEVENFVYECLKKWLVSDMTLSKCCDVNTIVLNKVIKSLFKNETCIKVGTLGFNYHAWNTIKVGSVWHICDISMLYFQKKCQIKGLDYVSYTLDDYHEGQDGFALDKDNIVYKLKYKEAINNIIHLSKFLNEHLSF